MNLRTQFYFLYILIAERLLLRNKTNPKLSLKFKKVCKTLSIHSFKKSGNYMFSYLPSSFCTGCDLQGFTKIYSKTTFQSHHRLKQQSMITGLQNVCAYYKTSNSRISRCFIPKIDFIFQCHLPRTF